jgi:hypothetical protein
MMLPPDIDGDTLPPAGKPAPIINLMDDDYGLPYDGLNIWELVVDWANPEGSSLSFNTDLNSLRTAPFNGNFLFCPDSYVSSNCIPQPGVQREQYLDMLPFFLMHRFAYRNFNDYESMVVSHSVEARPGQAGKRWYEIRRTGNAFNIAQQGTFSPDDGVNRWMGSIAQDRDGNMLLGYNVSNAENVFPGIRYTGRLAGDEPGKMTLCEGTLISGSGVQLDPDSRWGDYSSMNIDPSDDCTFWYTNEYYSTSSDRGWQTRIGSFAMPGCSKTPEPTPTQTPYATPVPTPQPTTEMSMSFDFSNRELMQFAEDETVLSRTYVRRASSK